MNLDCSRRIDNGGLAGSRCFLKYHWARTLGLIRSAIVTSAPGWMLNRWCHTETGPKPITISFFSRLMPTSVLFIQYSRYFTAASRNTCFQGWQNLGKKRKAKRWDNKHSTLTEIYNAQMISHHWPPADERQHTTVMNWRQFIRVSPPHDGWWISLHTSPTSGNKEIPRNRSKHNIDQTATTPLQETAF